MGKRVSAKLISGGLTLALTACFIGDIEEKSTSAVVFAAGYDSSGRATVWKDNAVFWRMEGQGGAFYSVCMSGNTVYAVGQTPNGRPFYWKSTEGNTFHYIGSGQGYATSVCVAGGQMYVTGWDVSGGKVWRDGVIQYDLGSDASPWAISVPGSGNSVYVAGWNDYSGCVWLNGELINHMDGVNAAFYSVDVSSGAFYAAGEFERRPVWKKAGDSIIHTLGSGVGMATSLQLSGDYLHIVGHDGGNGKVWRGLAQGTAMSALFDLGVGARPESVFVLGGDVYSGGWRDGGKVWKNNITLHNFGADSDVYSIFVVSQ